MLSDTNLKNTFTKDDFDMSEAVSFISGFSPSDQKEM